MDIFRHWQRERQRLKLPSASNLGFSSHTVIHEMNTTAFVACLYCGHTLQFDSMYSVCSCYFLNKNMDENGPMPVYIVYLDFQKTLDKVCQQRLLSFGKDIEGYV